MNVKVMHGHGLNSLLDILQQGHMDSDHEQIVAAVSEHTNNQLYAIEGVGDNRLARHYVQNLWTSVMEAFQEADIKLDAPKLSDVLRIIASSMEMRERLHKELHDRLDSKEEQKFKEGSH